MTARALKLDDRLPALPADRGRTLNAAQFAQLVCDNRVAPKWIRERFRHLAWKAGRELLWYENEARAAYAEFVEQQRRRA